MLTKEEYEQILVRQSKVEQPKVAMQVTSAELKKFENNTKLPSMILDRKIQNDIEKGLKAIHGVSFCISLWLDLKCHSMRQISFLLFVVGNFMMIL